MVMSKLWILLKREVILSVERFAVSLIIDLRHTINHWTEDTSHKAVWSLLLKNQSPLSIPIFINLCFGTYVHKDIN